ncbi:MAG: glycosyltransferase family 4 protein [Desulfobacteraceae bacterium]|nr:glycosyltransferase family 4 protein [Desulfobacteraceae bacterium]
MSLMKVCYLLPRLLPGKSGVVVGGCATNCVSLALELRRQGIQIELLAPVPKERLEFLSRHPIGEIVRPLQSIGTGLIGKGIGAIQVLRHSLKKRLREIHYDVVHSHSGTYPYAIVPLVANRRTSVRLHSLYCPIGAKGGVYTSWWEKPIAARLIFNKLDRIIAVTDNVRQSIEKAGVSSEKTESISMCVDTRRFCPRDRKEPSKYFPNRSKGARILFIGNSSKEKGLIELLQALQILTQKGIPLFLVAAVENQSEIKEYTSRYDYMKRLVAELGLAHNVQILGLIDYIENLYAETDLVVIPWNTSRGPSDYPMVALEAMAMGKCVVSTPVGGCPELLLGGKAGILTEGFSAESIATTIEFAIKHPEIRRLKSEVAMETVNNFSVETSAKHMINLYERLLKGKA